MKKNLLLISFVLVLSSVQLFSQIPNAGFEDWANNDPVGWSTYDVLFGDAVTQSSDSHSGSSAAKMQIVETLFPPFILSGFFTLPEKPGSLPGYYKFVPNDTDEEFSVVIILYTGSTPVGSGAWGDLPN